VSEEPFGSRLRRERERRRIALSSISANTKISVALFEALERDDVSRWPSGIFRRAFIRAYADAIGLDADVLTREFLERFPDPAEPAPTAVPEAVRPAPAFGDPVLRLTLADDGAPFRGGRLLGEMRKRWAAVGCDAGVVLAIAASVFAVSGKFWLPLGVSMLVYYLGGILLLGNTPGVCLWAPAPGRPDPPSISPTRLWSMVRSASAMLDGFTHSASAPDAQGTPRSDTSSNPSARESSGSSVRQLGTSSR
jgi:transcriptional regulator with XRE-family HTH domain